jgi:hypothetical protein
MLTKSVVILDVEAENSIAHTLALAATRFGRRAAPVGSKTRSGKQLVKPVNFFTTGDRVVIKITDVKVSDDKKHLTDLHTCMKTDFKMLFMKFHEAITFMNDFVEQNGGTLASHCLINDLAFLAKTQEHVGGKVIIRKNIEADPKHGVVDRRWNDFNLVCTRFLACSKAENFMRDYVASGPGVTASKKFVPTSLESFSRFVAEGEYNQKHSAAQDVIDLTALVKAMVEKDGPEIFGDCDQYINWDPINTYVPRVTTVTLTEKTSEPLTEAQIYGIRKRIGDRVVPSDLMNRINEKRHNMSKREASAFIQELETCPMKTARVTSQERPLVQSTQS